MSETKFSKGEWVVYIHPVYLNQGFIAVECGDKRIHDCKMYSSTEVEAIANAHLIAAAPEMYAMLDKLTKPYGLEDLSCDEVERLLAKARGES